MVKVDVPRAIAAGISRFGNPRRAKQFMRHRRENKEGDKQADAAIGDDGAGEHDREHGPLRPKTLGHELGDRSHRAAILHQLTEQGAEEKNREELHGEVRGASHESLRPVCEQRLSRQSGREDGGGGSEQKHAPAPVREPD